MNARPSKQLNPSPVTNSIGYTEMYTYIISIVLHPLVRHGQSDPIELYFSRTDKFGSRIELAQK